MRLPHMPVFLHFRIYVCTPRYRAACALLVSAEKRSYYVYVTPR